MMETKGSERMKWKWMMAMALVVFFAAGCSGIQDKKPVAGQPKVTENNDPEKNSGEPERPAGQPEKPNNPHDTPAAQPGKTTDPQAKPNIPPETTHQTIKIHDASIVKDSPMIKIIYPQIDG